MTNQQHAKAIKAIIDKFRNSLKIVDCYFHIEKVTIKPDSEGKIKFSLGPSPDESMTLKTLRDKEELFYNRVQAYLSVHKLLSISIKTEYRSWAVSGYVITFIDSYHV